MEAAPTPPILESDRDAVERLVERHGGALYAMALRLCGRPEDAEELVQDTFLNAYRGWRGFAGRSAETTWLYTIARRACLRRRRRRAGEPSRMEPLEELFPRPEEGVPDLGPAGDGPYDARRRHEAEEIVGAALQEIPLAFRLPLVLVDIAELSTAEAAEVLGLKENTVKTRVHRARLKLRRALADALPHRDAPPPDHSRSVCLDLLRAKLEALDRGVPFPYSQEALCARCRALFSTLDLGRDACRTIGHGDLPPDLRQAILGRIDARG